MIDPTTTRRTDASQNKNKRGPDTYEEGQVMTTGCGEYAYVEHLLAEHRRLEQLIHRTLAALPAWESADTSGWLPRMIEGLKAIRQEAANHFREEELGGCLEEAVAHCPSLSSEFTRAEKEQQELLA